MCSMYFDDVRLLGMEYHFFAEFFLYIKYCIPSVHIYLIDHDQNLFFILIWMFRYTMMRMVILDFDFDTLYIAAPYFGQ